MTGNSPSGSGPTSGLRQWIIEHDERWLFIVLYIGLAVTLSVWISLFWLVAVVAGHGVLEWIRQSHLHQSRRMVLVETLWELKLDIGLVLFALALALYMDLVLGVVGLQSAARLGAAARGGARFAAWERAIRGVLLSVDDMAQVARAVTVNRGQADGEEEAPSWMAASPWGSWQGSWGKGDWIALSLNVLCLLLILVSPLLTAHTPASALATMLTELHPWPSAD
jgi:hypothetical protein